MVGQVSRKLSEKGPRLRPEDKGKEAWGKALRQDGLGPLQKAEEASGPGERKMRLGEAFRPQSVFWTSLK